MHCFSDSVAVYNTYDGTTYLFNPILKWIFDITNNQAFTMEFIEDKISFEAEFQSNQTELLTLLSQTISKLLSLKIIELTH